MQVFPGKILYFTPVKSSFKARSAHEKRKERKREGVTYVEPLNVLAYRVDSYCHAVYLNASSLTPWVAL